MYEIIDVKNDKTLHTPLSYHTARLLETTVTDTEKICSFYTLWNHFYSPRRKALREEVAF